MSHFVLCSHMLLHNSNDSWGAKTQNQTVGTTGSVDFRGIYGRHSEWLRAGGSRDRIPVGGEILRTCPDRPWEPPSLLYNEYRVFPGGKKRPGRDADPSPTSSAVGHERVELYLYSPYGPYGLYRASVPVQACTLPYFLYMVRMSASFLID